MEIFTSSETMYACMSQTDSAAVPSRCLNCGFEAEADSDEGLTIELHSKDPGGGGSFEKVNYRDIPGDSVIPCNPPPDS